MSHEDFWWAVFYLGLAGNVYCWAIVALRVLQNFGKSFFANTCLVAHIFPPLGFVLAFTFGWLHLKQEGLRKVMILWTASALVFGTLGHWE